MILLRCSDRVCRLFNISNCGQMCDSRSWRRCCFWLPQCRCYHSSSVSLCFLWLLAAQRCPSLTPSTAGNPSETWIFREPPVMSCCCFQTGTTEWKTKERNNNNKYISNPPDASLIHCSEGWKQLLRLIERIQSATNRVDAMNSKKQLRICYQTISKALLSLQNILSSLKNKAAGVSCQY